MMKQIKVTSPTKEEDQIERLKNEINEIRRELKMHIQNCPFRSIQVER